MAREMGSPRHVDNRRRRTREGAEPASVRAPFHLLGSHDPSLEPTPARSVDLGKHSVKTHLVKTEIARSVSGPKLQGHHAEDAVAKPYLVQKIVVT